MQSCPAHEHAAPATSGRDTARRNPGGASGTKNPGAVRPQLRYDPGLTRAPYRETLPKPRDRGSNRVAPRPRTRPFFRKLVAIFFVQAVLLGVWLALHPSGSPLRPPALVVLVMGAAVFLLWLLRGNDG